MNLQKIQWKIYFDAASKPDPAEFFRVFNSWIPNSPEIFVDVADYKHVHDGPAVLLYGHTTDYALDLTDRRPGLLYSRKGEMEGTNGDKLKKTFVELCRSALKLPMQFSTADFKFLVNDRALAPNNTQTFEAIKGDLDKFCQKIFGPQGTTLKYIADPKQRFTVSIQNTSAYSLEKISS